ncbi:ATP-binding protein [uncultured Salinisphaera sp.]|uniref:ATP-binding protein n=1 Tax=uncultured Salinisphaera sp. TaxID=359372 RepID=UPI0032B1BBA7|tara:strand:+ start:8120 stop:9466 length:1347 start_codon:yes stop_codon:yes gene_type:complete
MINSLRARLLAATAVLLLAFTVLTGLALQTAVRERADQAEHDRLQGLSYALLGSADITADGAFNLAPRVLPESDLTRPESGLYAAVLNGQGRMIWHSPSLLGDIDIPDLPAVGQWQQMRVTGPSDAELISLSFGFRWVTEDGDDYRYTLVVAENASAFVKQMTRFRSVLWTLLSLSAISLLIVELLILRWGLAPLRRLARNLADLESDRDRRLEGHYPDEIQPLVSNLNTMLANDQARLTRYRNALGDLAHSLKTPMAILRGMAEDKSLSAATRDPLRTQLARMNDILDYQLQKAAAAGKRTLARPLGLRPIAERLGRALTKVYAEQNTSFDIAIPDELRAPLDEGDITELLGTLMDNAAKYGRNHVIVDARIIDRALVLWVDDNGAGFGDSAPHRLLERGVRADSAHEGQGLGLAVAAEIVRSYNGTIELGSADAGGARVIVRIPLS